MLITGFVCLEALEKRKIPFYLSTVAFSNPHVIPYPICHLTLISRLYTVRGDSCLPSWWAMTSIDSCVLYFPDLTSMAMFTSRITLCPKKQHPQGTAHTCGGKNEIWSTWFCLRRASMTLKAYHMPDHGTGFIIQWGKIFQVWKVVAAFTWPLYWNKTFFKTKIYRGHLLYWYSKGIEELLPRLVAYSIINMLLIMLAFFTNYYRLTVYISTASILPKLYQFNHSHLLLFSLNWKCILSLRKYDCWSYLSSGPPFSCLMSCFLF